MLNVLAQLLFLFEPAYPRKTIWELMVKYHVFLFHSLQGISMLRASGHAPVPAKFLRQYWLLNRCR